ncbi:GNAT family N-acetyltransferase [Elioraea sp.]|uniref:GNAT family N-acetyltransferase n=1 Tax=Elioraea sp. TaxID=2185103 RepID=UPI0025B90467|nr:GNAT family N-acetyltransferase [Elioraea sp.]
MPRVGEVVIEHEAGCDLTALGAAWRALESDAAPLALFQSWTWLGCLAAERFPDPVVIRAHIAGRIVGLALFNRVGGALHLGATGRAAQDSIHVEHNAPLVAREAPPGLAAAMLRAAWSVRGVGRLVLPGTPEGLAAAAGGVVLRGTSDPAPFVDLAAIAAGGGDYLATRSANARGQIRRSMRHFAEEGPLALSRPASLAEAEAWCDAMIVLHAESWQRRGKPGAFAEPFMRRFHAALLRDGLVRDDLPAGAVDPCRITAGEAVLGYLLNFRQGGVAYAYQSGFRHDEGVAQARPGLVAHVLAVEDALAAGLARYDFLAGPARYKLTLSTGAEALAWETRVRALSPTGLAAIGLGVARAIRLRR